MKKSRRAAAAERTAIAAEPPEEFREVEEPAPSSPAPPAPSPVQDVGSYLESIRSDALERFARLNAETRDLQYNASRTIAELEELKNQISCTIAFLRAQRRE